MFWTREQLFSKVAWTPADLSIAGVGQISVYQEPYVKGEIQESKDLSHCLQNSQIKQFSFPTRYFFMEV